ncbi:PilZ domain-containing protein [Methylobacterium haplocladii]|nr:PilZ domain-containing protein [Methylobacterium haplocladii]GJD83385.1 hypothetical protein HPGCJGGD_1251 [Methylobacterium haplocladii]
MSEAMLDWVGMSAGDDAPVRDFHVDRREERTEANLIAVIRLPDGSDIRCVVKDVSKSGAKLGIPRGCALPETFLFKVNGRDFVFQVRLAWQRDCYAGVRIERIGRLPPTFGSA